jgi:hypothetical protein
MNSPALRSAGVSPAVFQPKHKSQFAGDTLIR